MTDCLYEFPSDDAPIREWLKPVSAQMINRRAPTSFSGAEPTRQSNVSKRRGRGRQNDGEIRRLAKKGLTAPEIAKRVGMAAPGVRCAAQRMGITIKTTRKSRRED